MRVILSIIVVFLLLFGDVFSAEASPCRVDSDLSGAIAKVKEGKCRTQESQYLKPYREYLSDIGVADVVLLDSNFSLFNPVVLDGDSEVPLLLIGSNSVTLSGNEGRGAGLWINRNRVLIDKMTWTGFSGSAMTIVGNSNILLHQKIVHGGGVGLVVSGRHVQIIASEIAENLSHGAQVTGEGPVLFIGTKIHSSQNGFGLLVQASSVAFQEGEIFDNALGGVRVEEENSSGKPNALWVSESSFSANGPQGDRVGILPLGKMLPAPEGVLALEKGKGLVVSGKVPLEKIDPWFQIGFDPQNVEIEIYVAVQGDGAQGKRFLASTRGLTEKGHFSLEIHEKMQGMDGVVALVQDRLNRWASPFSNPFYFKSESPKGKNGDASDWDGDGLRNDQEDWNRDGKIDLLNGETDPRLKDTDGDGLSDGEEVALHLDPTKMDSDGDCLPDGVEMGVSEFKIETEWIATLDAVCIETAKVTGSIKPENGIWIGEEEEKTWDNVVAFFDLDPSTKTDPTNPDTDGDGIPDGQEDLNLNGRFDLDSENESDATKSDTDEDGLPDGEEKICGESSRCGPEDSDRIKKDTDGDGLLDGEERNRFHTFPNQCDSDDDGLGDGLEGGRINPNADRPECIGLQDSGSNFYSVEQLDPLSVDSDKDGLSDGVEDANHNGWLDFNETDPTNPDTDGDGVSDGVEMKLDRNSDGIVDFDMRLLKNGKNCSPPSMANDLDCDGLVNALDLDSDNDGCEDQHEDPSVDLDFDGVPDIWEKTSNACNVKKNGGGGSASPNIGGNSGSDEEGGEVLSQESDPQVNSGGPACQLISDPSPGSPWILEIYLGTCLFLLGGTRIKRSIKSNKYNA